MWKLTAKLLDEHRFVHGFSTRQGGVSEGPFASMNLGRATGDLRERVEENHRRLAARVGYDPGRLFEVSQVHGDRVRVVASDEDPVVVRAEEGDALVAFEPTLALGVRTADCVPVLIGDAKTRGVAAVHAGWRGVTSKIVDRAIDALCARGSREADLRVAIGPHIRACCFEVAADVAAQLEAAARTPASVVTSRGDKALVDLAALVVAQLAERGVARDQVDILDGCTKCDATRFHSFRRDGKASGRHLSVIVAG